MKRIITRILFVVLLLSLAELGRIEYRRWSVEEGETGAEPGGLSLGAWLQPEEPERYAVRFYCGEELLSEQLLCEGETAAVPTELPQGTELLAWCDADGSETEISPVGTEEMNYYAKVKPVLSGHESFLFLTEEGFLRPDDALTGEELSAALSALTECTEEYLPELPEGESVTGAELREVLSAFVPFEEMNLALDEPVSRRSFAKIVTALTERNEHMVTLAENAVAAVDVSPKDEDFAALREAYLPHTSGGFLWDTLTVSTQYEEGFLLLNGTLYYVTENGTLLRDGKIKTLQFDAQGRFTSGNEELDGIVRELTALFVEENPEMSREELLRVAYNYSRDSFKYLRRNAYDFGAKGWEVQDALTIFTTGKGNCYCYAAAFWALARNLGFDAYAVAGTIGTDAEPHAWVVMQEEDESIRYYDPETEMTYLLKNITSKDMFRMEQSYYRGWSYQRPLIDFAK